MSSGLPSLYRRGADIFGCRKTPPHRQSRNGTLSMTFPARPSVNDLLVFGRDEVAHMRELKHSLKSIKRVRSSINTRTSTRHRAPPPTAPNNDNSDNDDSSDNENPQNMNENNFENSFNNEIRDLNIINDMNSSTNDEEDEEDLSISNDEMVDIYRNVNFARNISENNNFYGNSSSRENNRQSLSQRISQPAARNYPPNQNRDHENDENDNNYYSELEEPAFDEYDEDDSIHEITNFTEDLYRLPDIQELCNRHEPSNTDTPNPLEAALMRQQVDSNLKIDDALSFVSNIMGSHLNNSNTSNNSTSNNTTSNNASNIQSNNASNIQSNNASNIQSNNASNIQSNNASNSTSNNASNNLSNITSNSAVNNEVTSNLTANPINSQPTVNGGLPDIFMDPVLNPNESVAVESGPNWRRRRGTPISSIPSSPDSRASREQNSARSGRNSGRSSISRNEYS
ncbi:hypothetical protein TRFO_02650 [Tritrichomonas foetus]|uniref:Uncharacterized protein n=1 Tax=Tritrichomonas foetus TaxID=1144522 RepID=A0A1J4KYT9_9EUKA|nr:hypothetical protein TRFO_02650 [Tritrichomonas foetus]|eukprot:OHT16409.1 hypothetical protein TRFO_02650 [Tritrichomonas foetus]